MVWKLFRWKIKKIHLFLFCQNCPKRSHIQIALKEIYEKIAKKYIRSFFRQNCPKSSHHFTKLHKLNNLWNMTKFFTRVEKIFEKWLRHLRMFVTLFIRVRPIYLSKSLISLKLKGAGKFISWLCHVLEPTHQLIPKLRFMYGYFVQF